MSLKNKHIINKRQSLLSALKVINTLMPDPLVLFVVDDDDKMVGTLTDGDSRRALIAGVSVNDSIEKVMHKNFNFLRRGVDDDVQQLLKRRIDVDGVHARSRHHHIAHGAVGHTNDAL